MSTETHNRPAAGAEILTVTSLNKVYGSGPDGVEAIRDISFTLKAGEMVCIVGPSGAGKTTLLRSIAGLLPPTDGELVMEGSPITGPPKGMAVVFQEYARSLFPWLTVFKNVELPLKERGMPKAQRAEKVHAALDAVGLSDVPHSYPWQLSGGMQQRVAIARAVANAPLILLADEPTGNLDPATASYVFDALEALVRQSGLAALIATHNHELAARMDRRVTLAEGRIVEF
jgi:NitT/TauT family transport system ATP-binding protein